MPPTTKELIILCTVILFLFVLFNIACVWCGMPINSVLGANAVVIFFGVCMAGVMIALER